MQPFIRVSQLKQSFGAQEVLKGVSFDVDKGELLALIGGSGAGKSVILKHLDGLMNPLDGYVDIDGRRISNVPEKIKVDWLTVPICRIKCVRSKYLRSSPSNSILPEVGSFMRWIKPIIVDFPAPLGPTIAT